MTHILIVDDEPGMRNFLMRTLETRCGFVDEAADTAEATRKLDERHFDIVILDNIMPKKTCSSSGVFCGGATTTGAASMPMPATTNTTENSAPAMRSTNAFSAAWSPRSRPQ